jgi:AraC-like DNA-binding protein
MEIAGRGRVVFWPGGSLWLARISGTSAWHRHHAIQMCLPLDGPAQLQAERDGTWAEYTGALIASDVPHGFRAPGRLVANILVAPESRLGRGLGSVMAAAGMIDLPEPVVAPLRALFADAQGLTEEQLVARAWRAIAALAGGDPPKRGSDPRMQLAIDTIRSRLGEPVRLNEIAEIAGLSPGRFRHLFVAETGVGLRAFILWERLNRALAIGFGGQSWTVAAHAAHFADSAHLTRTCRRMLGFAPSAARPER